MWRSLALTLMVWVAASVGAKAEGALAVGCGANNLLVFGWWVGESSPELARRKALDACQRQGSECTLLRETLMGDGAWVALAFEPDPDPPPTNGCTPFGWSYAQSRDRATSMALADCQQKGGNNCAISLIRQNTTTYTAAPPRSTRSPTGRCQYFQREVWGPYGFVTCK
jgi:hypothetical protein